MNLLVTLEIIQELNLSLRLGSSHILILAAENILNEKKPLLKFRLNSCHKSEAKQYHVFHLKITVIPGKSET